MSDWFNDVRNCIMEIDKKVFYLNDVYAFKDRLSAMHPDNNHIEDKIRQQLQLLRDKGVIEFVNDNGTYRKIN